MEDEKEMLEEEETHTAEEQVEDAPAAEEEDAVLQDEAEEEDATLSDEEIEYDENGDIIIPDGIDAGNTSNGGDAEEEKPAAEPDERDTELQRLRERNAELESQAKDTLKQLGVETEDVMDGLAEIAAESADMSKEDYKKQRQQQRTAEKEAEAKKIADFEALAARDLAELKEIYPETKGYKHVRDMPKDVLMKFARNRNLGLSAKEAYAAANIDGIRNGAVSTGKRQAMNESKAHLQSSHPKAAKRDTIRIPAKDMNMWREMFPGKSDKEIAALYKKTL